MAARFDWNWVEAERGYRQAIELDPNSVQTRHWYALYLVIRGRFEEARAQMSRALELDPLSLIIMTGLGRMYHFLGDDAKSVEYFRKALELDPNFPQAHFDIGLTYLHTEQFDEALAALGRAVELSQGRTLWTAVLGWAYGLAGRRENAERILADLESAARARHVSPYEFGLVHLGLGNTERALDYFEQAYEERSSLVLYLSVEPSITNELREHSRFQRILQKVSLA